MAKLIVFIGPQGSGKSTQAKLLSKAYGFKTVKLIDYSLLHITFLRLATIIGKILRETTTIKFYEDSSPYLRPSPRLFKALLPILVFLHILGLFVSSLRLFYVLIFKEGFFVEDEGFIYKQLADLLFSIKYRGITFKPLYLKLFLSLSLRMANYIDKVIFFEVPNYGELRQRYCKDRNKGLSWRAIEPLSYIRFQLAVYRALGFDCKINSSKEVDKVFKEVESYIIFFQLHLRL